MSKWLNKQTIIVFILTALIFSGIPSMAASTIKEAYFNDGIKIQIDEQAVEIETVTVTLEGETNGKNYVSVRDLAEAMGGTVGYLPATKTITIDTNNTEEVNTVSEQTITNPETTTDDNSPFVNVYKMEFNEATGLPVGVNYTTYKDITTAVEYNSNIYLSKSDLKVKFNIGYRSDSPDTTTYGKDGVNVVINLDGNSENYFFNNKGSLYMNVELFKSIIGE